MSELKRNGLDRATYFELKVQGYSDELIRKKYKLYSRALAQLRSSWGFTGTRTETFMKWMEEAQKGREYVKK